MIVVVEMFTWHRFLDVLAFPTVNIDLVENDEKGVGL